jgi:hypothetical protein
VLRLRLVVWGRLKRGEQHRRLRDRAAEGSDFEAKGNGHERVSDGDDRRASEGSPPASRTAMCLRFSLPGTHTPYDLSRISPVAAIPLVHASRHP